jgi:dTDP-4-dehydrorhamnose 3,5-epimerase
MKVIRSKIKDVLVLEPTVFEDNRGFFFETYHYQRYAEAGIDVTFVQDNHSRSLKNSLRGLHYQVNPGQAKLVRVIAGEVFDVAVDIRFGSPTFGQWVGYILSATNKKQIYIPVGFAHGFCVLSDVAEFEYKCSAYYSQKDERGIQWNDPDVGIDWPVKNPLLSSKDQKNPPFKEIAKDFTFDSFRITE